MCSCKICWHWADVFYLVLVSVRLIVSYSLLILKCIGTAGDDDGCDDVDRINCDSDAR